MTVAKDKQKQDKTRQSEDVMPDEDRQVLGKAYDGDLVRRLLQYVMPYKGRLFAAIGFMITASLLGVAGPFIIGRAIDDGIRAGNLEVLRMWTLVFAIAAAIEFVTNRGRIALMAFVGTRVVADVRETLYHHLHKLSLNFYNNYSIGRLMSRLVGDVDILQDFITWSLTGLFRAFFTLSGIVAAMLLLNVRLALVAFIVVPIMVYATNIWRVRVRDAYRKTRERLSIINGYLNESITGIRVTKSFSRERKNTAHFEGLNQSYFEANVEAARVSAIFFPGVDFLGSVAMALVVAVGGMLVLGESLTAGTLVAFVLYVTRFFEPIRELAQRYNVFQATMASSERLFRLLDIEPDLLDAPNARELPDIDGKVVFKDVNFSYNDGEPVLRDLNLIAEPGQRIALVGETGAGKSTIIRLLTRFFDISSGAIEIDGHDIREVTQSSLREQLGIVLQDTFLFSGSVMDNIRYGRLGASDEAVVAAAKAVGAHKFIVRLPNGYDMDVGENGVNLSVGQRQMVSFARALLADPRILILDEATSSVDTTTEKQIEQALDTLMQGRTSFVIAHRLSTIVNADKIVVLDQGRVVEMGSHMALLAQRGRYYNLYTMQWAAAQAEPQSVEFSQN